MLQALKSTPHLFSGYVKQVSSEDDWNDDDDWNCEQSILTATWASATNIVERLDVQSIRHVPANSVLPWICWVNILESIKQVERIVHRLWNTGIDTSDEPNEISIGYGENGVFLDGQT